MAHSKLAQPLEEMHRPGVIRLSCTQDEAAGYIAEKNSKIFDYALEIHGSDGIRLLTIDAGAFEEPISCTLSVANPSRDSTYKYDALSYCWGDKTLIRTIEVNGHPGFVVTSNLFAAIRRARDKTLPTVIWVDMICIHQADLSERSQQVSMMREIFEQAQKVLCWLGPCGSTAAVLDDCEQCLDHEMLRRPITGSSVTCRHSDWFNTEGDIIDKWWRRIWTVCHLLVKLNWYVNVGFPPYP